MQSSAVATLPALLQRLSEDRERLGLRPVQMAGRLHLTFRQYRSLERVSCTSTTTCTSGSRTCAGGPVAAGTEASMRVDGQTQDAPESGSGWPGLGASGPPPEAPLPLLRAGGA